MDGFSWIATIRITRWGSSVNANHLVFIVSYKFLKIFFGVLNCGKFMYFILWIGGKFSITKQIYYDWMSQYTYKFDDYVRGVLHDLRCQQSPD